MPKSVSLGEHFERFVEQQVKNGRYNNESEVARAGLRLLEKYELELDYLRALVDEGDRDYAEGAYTVVDDPSAVAIEIGKAHSGAQRSPRNWKRLRAAEIMSRGREAGLGPDEIVDQIRTEIYPDRTDDKLARRCYTLTIREALVPLDFPALDTRR